MKDKLNKLKQFLLLYIEDFLILGGLLIINIATFLISVVAGLYVTGLILLVLGIVFSKYPPKQRR